jgi:DNA polymerase III delta prime subunit
MKSIIKSTNDVVEVTTDGLIDLLTKSFTLFTMSNQIKEHPSVFLHGQPGVGKSQAVIEIARQLEKNTGLKTYVTDIRLLLFTPVDLRGIPIVNKESMTSIWLKPEIFNLIDDSETINIFFLDELTAAPPSLQASAYQIALDRRLGEHKLPNNTFVIAAGNRLDDYAISYEMPTALRNRFMHIELYPDYQKWLKWANSHYIHHKIIEFLSEHPDKFYTKDLSTKSPIIITPRTWEMLSKLMYHMDDDLQNNRDIISSVIGKNMTRLFVNDVQGYDINPIVLGEEVEVPKNLEDIHACIIAVESRIEEFIESKNNITNILSFIKKLPTDFALRVFRKILQYEPVSYSITEIGEYHELIKTLEEI